MKHYIVLPYKDREGKYKKALDEFLEPFYEYLNANLPEFEILIVEQKDGSLNTNLPSYYSNLSISKTEEFFNLGRTINIGFDFFSDKIKDEDIFIFHPVDLLPIDVDYNIRKSTKFCYKDHSPNGDFYKSIGFLTEDFKKINGFSNNFWGWGLEDDDLFIRTTLNHVSFEKKIDDYRRLTNDGNGLDDSLHHMPLYDFNHQFKGQNYLSSGLNNLNYNLIKTEKIKNNITKIIIS